MNAHFPDYTKKSYYWRLFHEGRPCGARWAHEHTKAQMKGREEFAAMSSQARYRNSVLDDLFLGTPAGEPESSVDPLADYPHEQLSKAIQEYMDTGTVKKYSPVDPLADVW